MARLVPSSFRWWLTAGTVLFFVVGVVYVCTFKVMDRDFWWHITAGEIMVKTLHLIEKDPFAWTRTGLTYASNREWLAQVVLYLTHAVGGSTGIILLRTALTLTAFGLLLLIGRRVLWPFALVVLWAVHLNRPSLMERPQLFTFVFFAVFLVFAFRHLRWRETGADGSGAARFPLFASFLLQVLWVNMHGAAASLSVLLAGLLLLQAVVRPLRPPQASGERLHLVALLTILLFSLLLSPEGGRTFTDLWMLTHDPALPLVREWRPLPLSSYLPSVGPFWIAALAALAAGRRSLLFCLSLLLVTGAMSLLAFRHIILFTMAASAVVLFQGAQVRSLQSLLDRIARWRVAAASGTFVVFLSLGYAAYAQDIAVLYRQGLFGYGQAPVADGACAFLAAQNPQGRMFNSYNVGSYLIYCGYPHRRVFLDGRNVEHGFARINGALLAGTDPEVWKRLEEAYGFTYAVMDVLLTPDRQHLFYAPHLSENPGWSLVFLDDVSMVYLKNTPANAPIIAEHAYRHVTPERLEFGTLWQQVPSRSVPAAETELLRLIAASDRSIKARLQLAHAYRETGRVDEAEGLLREALRLQPGRPEVYEQLGVLALGRSDWKAAGLLFEEAIRRSGGVGPSVDYTFLSDVFLRAGDLKKARAYEKRALRQQFQL